MLRHKSYRAGLLFSIGVPHSCTTLPRTVHSASGPAGVELPSCWDHVGASDLMSRLNRCMIRPTLVTFTCATNWIHMTSTHFSWLRFRFPSHPNFPFPYSCCHCRLLSSSSSSSSSSSRLSAPHQVPPANQASRRLSHEPWPSQEFPWPLLAGHPPVTDMQQHTRLSCNQYIVMQCNWIFI